MQNSGFCVTQQFKDRFLRDPIEVLVGINTPKCATRRREGPTVAEKRIANVREVSEFIWIGSDATGAHNSLRENSSIIDLVELHHLNEGDEIEYAV
jgi:hypothetical protein